jgi:hypothetical protein
MPALMSFSALLFLAVAIVYVVHERRGRARWREVVIGTAPAVDDAAALGPYREAGTVPVMLRRAPGEVRGVALSCLALGAMAVPGALMGLAGLLFASGIGLVSIPGLIAAVKLFRAGLALLRRDRRALSRIASAVAWELWLNGIIAALSVIGTLFVAAATDPADVFSASRLLGWLGIAGTFDLYGAVSITQALALRAVARRYADALAPA